jgi:hypothetical protein
MDHARVQHNKLDLSGHSGGFRNKKPSAPKFPCPKRRKEKTQLNRLGLFCDVTSEEVVRPYI